MKKEKIAVVSGGVKNAEKKGSLPEASDTLIKEKKQYASPDDLSPEDLKIYLAGEAAQRDIISNSSVVVDKNSLVLDPLWNFASYNEEPDDNFMIGILEPASKRYPSLSIKTIGLIPSELYDDNFCDELKSVVDSFINQKVKDDEEQ